MLTIENIRAKLSDFTKIPINKIQDDMQLTELVADSFVLVELMLTLQEDFSIHLSQQELENVHCIADLLQLLESKSNHKLTYSAA